MPLTTTLIESKARPFGSSKGALVSMGIHGAVIALAVFATTQVVLPPREKVEEHHVLYVAPPPPKALEPPPAPLPKAPEPPKVKVAEKVFKAPPPPKRAPAPRAPTPAPVQPKVAATPTPAIAAPTKVAVTIPDIDLKAPPVTEIAVAPPAENIKASGVSTSGSVKRSDDGDVEGSAGGRKGGLTSGNSGKAFDENQVDSPVQVSRKVEPRYPEALKSVNVQGTVVMRFIVSAEGRVEPGSIEAIDSPNKLFTDAVRSALLQTRYRPAEAGGQKVRQLVEQSFAFRLNDR